VRLPEANGRKSLLERGFRGLVAMWRAVWQEARMIHPMKTATFT